MMNLETKKTSKILILSTTSGGGHMSVSKSLKQILQDSYEVVIVDIYKDILNSNDAELYNLVLKYNLSFLHWPIFVKFFRLKNFLLKKIITNKFKVFFEKNQFDLVISVSHFLNEMIATSVNTKFIIFPTDLSNPYPKYWYSANDLIITCIDQLFTQAIASGYTNVKKINGLPLRQDFYLPLNTSANTTNMSIKLLIMYGKTPPNNIYTMVLELMNITNLQITVICGKNHKLYNKLQLIKHIKTYEFVENIQQIIDEHDLVVTKPGPTTIFEVAARGKYLLIENNRLIMKQEKYNINFVLKHKLGNSFNSRQNLKQQVLAFNRTTNLLVQNFISSPSTQINSIIESLLI